MMTAKREGGVMLMERRISAVRRPLLTHQTDDKFDELIKIAVRKGQKRNLEDWRRTAEQWETKRPDPISRTLRIPGDLLGSGERVVEEAGLGDEGGSKGDDVGNRL